MTLPAHCLPVPPPQRSAALIQVFLATKIIEAAQYGERDPDRLAGTALGMLAATLANGRPGLWRGQGRRAGCEIAGAFGGNLAGAGKGLNAETETKTRAAPAGDPAALGP
jgi:hypothetical protein